MLALFRLHGRWYLLVLIQSLSSRVHHTVSHACRERFLGQAILIVTVGAAVNQDGHGSASGVKRVRDALARERAICAELGKVREF